MNHTNSTEKGLDKIKELNLLNQQTNIGMTGKRRNRKAKHNSTFV